MRLHIKKLDLFLVVGTSLAILLLGFFAWQMRSSYLLLVPLCAAVFFLLFCQFELYRRLIAHSQEQALYQFQNRKQDYRQIEAMLSLLSVIKPVRPLPAMREWAISPDIANILVSHVFDHLPKTIVECGSGASTIIMSYCLKEIGGGHIWSFDHDEDYAEKTRENLRRHSLIDLTTTIFAPLGEVTLDGEKWLWYDKKCLEGIEGIDLLFIDGPPRTIQKMARYPALPLLIDSLNEGAVIILDDTHREDEKETLRRWLEEFDCFDVETYDTEFGTAILRKKNTSRRDA